MIWVCYADTSPLNDDGLYQAIYKNTSSIRREKADRLRMRNDRNLCLGAGFLLDCCLKMVGLREADRKYGEQRNGKPVFTDHPELCFSLSHSGTIAMAALSVHDLGCDIEKIKEIDMAVAKRFFAPGEYAALLAQLSDGERKELFFRIWTLKESFLKATGQGFAFPMRDFEIIMKDERISAVQTADEKQYSFRELVPYDGYRSAVCSEEENPELQICYPEIHF